MYNTTEIIKPNKNKDNFTLTGCTLPDNKINEVILKYLYIWDLHDKILGAKTIVIIYEEHGKA
jgi:hypothetical protein